MMYREQPPVHANTASRESVDAARVSQAVVCDVERALGRLGGDLTLLIELVQIYCEDAPLLLVRISKGVTEANCADVRHAAHLLRCLAANFNARQVTQQAERLEAIAIGGRLEDAAATIEELRTEAARLEEALRCYC